jgi:UDP-2,4-diacetamido-2,4,6-trideoxy-beta-L-altropyranose hydrolase
MTSRAGRLRNRRLILRADATPALGTGHLMRLLALGQAWVDSGGDAVVVYADAPAALVRRFETEAITAIGLAAAHPDARDREEVRELLDESPDSTLVVDGPTFDLGYLDALSKSHSVLLIDDIAGLPRYPVAVVLNQNAHASRAAYPSGPEPRYLLGLDYALLRREFRSLQLMRTVADRAGRILVTLGGSDPSGMTERTIGALADLQKRGWDIDVRVVVGAGNQRTEEISRAAAATIAQTLKVERTVTDMAPLMLWADLVVTSGGTTVWELARCGAPALVIEAGFSEHLLVEGLERVGLYDRLGPADQLTHEQLVAAIERRLDDRDWRSDMARLGPALVDGQGAGRVLDVLSTLGAP